MISHSITHSVMLEEKALRGEFWDQWQELGHKVERIKKEEKRQNQQCILKKHPGLDTKPSLRTKLIPRSLSYLILQVSYIRRKP